MNTGLSAPGVGGGAGNKLAFRILQRIYAISDGGNYKAGQTW